MKKILIGFAVGVGIAVSGSVGAVMFSDIGKTQTPAPQPVAPAVQAGQSIEQKPVAPALSPLELRLRSLEARVGALEAKQ